MSFINYFNLKKLKSKNCATFVKTSKIYTAIFLLAFSSFFIFSQPSFANIQCQNLFSTETHKSYLSEHKQGVQFLLQQNPNLHQSSGIEKTSNRFYQQNQIRLQKPPEKVGQWLNYLDSLYLQLKDKPQVPRHVKNFFYKSFVIKEEDIPQSYFDFQARLAREQGHGPLTLSSEQKKQRASILIEDQKNSLDPWIEYLLSKDTSMYPMWAKYWMFSGAMKLSKLDMETFNFNRRDKGTVAPFAELNREALSYVMDLIVKKIDSSDRKKNLEDLQDPDLIKILDGMNFGKLYAYALKKAGLGANSKFKTNEGQWVVYKKGSDHLPLVQSLQGKNTGWCTAGEATAKTQLFKGDFHVYYSLDEFGHPTLPRVAIRMEDSKIAEVRGVGSNQNLDEYIVKSRVIDSKMKEFGKEGDDYIQKNHDMQLLTRIESKNKLGQVLNKTELEFLYEIKRKIMGFGYQKDPRIEEIKKQRDTKDDLVIVFENNDTINSDVDLYGLTSAEGLKFPDTINGNLYLYGLTSAEGLKLPDTINGSLYLNALKSANGLKLPDTINGDLDLSSLTSAEGLKLPDTINGYLNLSSLTSAEGLKLPDTINGNLYLYGLTSAEGLKLPDTINGCLIIKVAR